MTKEQLATELPFDFYAANAAGTELQRLAINAYSQRILVAEAVKVNSRGLQSLASSVVAAYVRL